MQPGPKSGSGASTSHVAPTRQKGVDIGAAEQAGVAGQRVFEASEGQPRLDRRLTRQSGMDAVQYARRERIAAADPVDNA